MKLFGLGRVGFPGWLARPGPPPRRYPQLQLVVESEWLRGNRSSGWAPGEGQAQYQPDDLTFDYPLDADAIRAEFVLPEEFVLSASGMGEPFGQYGLRGGTRELGDRQLGLREQWWSQWRAGSQQRVPIQKWPAAVAVGTVVPPNSASRWRLLDGFAHVPARMVDGRPVLGTVEGHVPCWPSLPSGSAAPPASATLAGFVPRLVWMRDLVEHLPPGQGLTIDADTPSARRLTPQQAQDLRPDAVRFPASAQVSFFPARAAWLTQLTDAERFADLRGLRGLWPIGYQVEDAEERVGFVYEASPDGAQCLKALEGSLRRRTARLRKFYRVEVLSLAEVPAEHRQWVTGQTPLVG